MFLSVCFRVPHRLVTNTLKIETKQKSFRPNKDYLENTLKETPTKLVTFDSKA